MAHERIEINPAIMAGTPGIRDTRVPVELILRKLGAGMAPEEILVDHPRLTLDDVRAAQAVAADYLAEEEIIADKCVDAGLVGELRGAEHDVFYRSSAK